MTPEEMQMRCAAALRNAIALTEEGSELRGLVAEALAYAEGDLASFDEPGLCGEDFMESVEIRLDIEDIDDPLYDALLETFRYKAESQGLDPKAYHYDEWKVSCVARREDVEHDEAG